MTAPTPDDRPAGRRALRAVALAGAAAVLGAIALVAGPAPAGAAGASSTHGHLQYAWQSTVTHHVHVRGYAWDRRHPHDSVRVGIIVNGRRLRTIKAHDSSPGFDSAQHIVGKHAFEAILPARPGADYIRIEAHPVGGGSHRTIDRQRVGHRTPENERILEIAKRHVGDSYSYGADGPYTFDCSGYTEFVYKRADAAHLPHNAEGQRTSGKVHSISRRHLRKGDLVFFMSGGSAYHVAIYAGNDTIYSAANPNRGVDHEHIWSSHVRYGTTWH